MCCPVVTPSPPEISTNSFKLRLSQQHGQQKEKGCILFEVVSSCIYIVGDFISISCCPLKDRQEIRPRFPLQVILKDVISFTEYTTTKIHPGPEWRIDDVISCLFKTNNITQQGNHSSYVLSGFFTFFLLSQGGGWEVVHTMKIERARRSWYLTNTFFIKLIPTFASFDDPFYLAK